MSLFVGGLIVTSLNHSLWHEINIIARPNRCVVENFWGTVGVFKNQKYGQVRKNFEI